MREHDDSHWCDTHAKWYPCQECEDITHKEMIQNAAAMRKVIDYYCNSFCPKYSEELKEPNKHTPVCHRANSFLLLSRWIGAGLGPLKLWLEINKK